MFPEMLRIVRPWSVDLVDVRPEIVVLPAPLRDVDGAFRVLRRDEAGDPAADGKLRRELRPLLARIERHVQAAIVAADVQQAFSDR